jgi:hypothetical protein
MELQGTGHRNGKIIGLLTNQLLGTNKFGEAEPAFRVVYALPIKQIEEWLRANNPRRRSRTLAPDRRHVPNALRRLWGFLDTYLGLRGRCPSGRADELNMPTSGSRMMNTLSCS